MKAPHLSAAALAGALAGALVLSGCTADDALSDSPPAGAVPTATPAAPTSAAPTTALPTTTPPAAAAPVVPPGDLDVPVLEGRIAALVLGISSSGRLAFDPILFLTGEDAEEAARARGEEDPPPNDYYVVNDDRALRDLPVAGGTAVSMVMDASGELCGDVAVGCPPISVEEWAAALEGASGDLLQSMPYWLTVSQGTATAVEQQFVP